MELDAVFLDELFGAFLVKVEYQSTAREPQFVTAFHCAQEELRLLVGIRRKEIEAVRTVEIEFEEIDEFLSLDDAVRTIRYACALGIEMVLESAFALMNLLGDG